MSSSSPGQGLEAKEGRGVVDEQVIDVAAVKALILNQTRAEDGRIVVNARDRTVDLLVRGFTGISTQQNLLAVALLPEGLNQVDAGIVRDVLDAT